MSASSRNISRHKTLLRALSGRSKGNVSVEKRVKKHLLAQATHMSLDNFAGISVNYLAFVVNGPDILGEIGLGTMNHSLPGW